MNPIKDPIKDALVPLRTNFNANGYVRWRTSIYLNLFHWPKGKKYGNRNGVCRYVRAEPPFSLLYTLGSLLLAPQRDCRTILCYHSCAAEDGVMMFGKLSRFLLLLPPLPSLLPGTFPSLPMSVGNFPIRNGKLRVALLK